MRKLILILLFALTFSSIASAHGGFQLTKAPVSNINLTKGLGTQTNDFDSCVDYCNDDYVSCHNSGEDDRVCAIDYSECLMDCYYYL